MSRCWKKGSFRFTDATHFGLFRTGSYQLVRLATSWWGHFTDRRTLRSSVSVLRSNARFIVVWLKLYFLPCLVLGASLSLSAAAGGGSSGGGGCVVRLSRYWRNASRILAALSSATISSSCQTMTFFSSRNRNCWRTSL